jgi:hypothetical protein
MDTTAIISMAVFALCYGLWFTARLTRRNHDPIDNHPNGDCFPAPVMRGDFTSSSHDGGVSNP